MCPASRSQERDNLDLKPGLVPNMGPFLPVASLLLSRGLCEQLLREQLCSQHHGYGWQRREADAGLRGTQEQTEGGGGEAGDRRSPSHPWTWQLPWVSWTSLDFHDDIGSSWPRGPAKPEPLPGEVL